MQPSVIIREIYGSCSLPTDWPFNVYCLLHTCRATACFMSSSCSRPAASDWLLLTLWPLCASLDTLSVCLSVCLYVCVCLSVWLAVHTVYPMVTAVRYSSYSLFFPDELRVSTHPWKSLKVLEFCSPKFKALKVLENRTGSSKSLNFISQVLEFESPWIHKVRLRDISNFVKQVFCLKQDFPVIVMLCFYQLKLCHNCRNRR